ncbi:methanol oxidation system protein MoxJ [Methylobrevis albus]|uniref:Methanol oxidation system protein MoxJ n=1 Tax=Methylobrevis albus TaxID=2793297 RepID=A0A931MY07_9HYPH|nr:methanol oxidation system protein MoxJ [Methylobrevis albus]MBH0237877.1 methanol oxidation system protein MoxJ [Methylobrevis albus]
MMKSAIAAGSLVAAAVLATGPAAAEATLKICASTKEAPYSAADAAGFENKIAVKLAEAMGRTPEFVWTDKFGVYLVRDFLDPKACDVVFGVDAGDERLLTSSSIYRTGYVFVSRADENFDGHNWQDLAKPDYGRFAVRFYSPAEVMLKYTGKWEDNAAYLYGLINFKSSRNSYNQVEASRLVSEVVAGEADLAIAFAPDVARYVKSSTVPVRMTMIEDDITRSDGQVIPLKYDQAIGVRKDDTALMAEIEAALGKIRGDIDQILADEGIPLLPPSS